MIELPNCSARDCRHLDGPVDDGHGLELEDGQAFKCAAFPLGIPDDIADLDGGNLHLTPDSRQARGTDEIVYEPRDG